MTAPVHLGQMLREARERRGLTIQRLSEETTIPVGDIEALESGHVDALPRAMYRRAEVRAYAEAVGLDPALVLGQLGGASPQAAPVGAAVVAAAPASVALLPVRRSHPAISRAATASVATRAGRAVIVLLIGCAALLWEQASAPSSDEPESPALTVPMIEPASLIDEAVRIAEPPPSPPTLRRVLYDPRVAANGQRWPRDGRLDEGVLVVHSTPRGARVTVNGVGWGVTPVAIRYLPFGTLRVRVGKADHRIEERVVRLSRDQPSSTLRVTLPQLARRQAAAGAKKTGDMLVITTVPSGARVTVNGIGWGTTPVSIAHLPQGAQRVRVVKDQFRSEERMVHVGDGQQGRVAITLKPAS